MDLPRLDALSRHWKEWPPVHISVAAYLGAGSKTASQQNDSGFDSMMASLPVKEISENGR